MKARAAAYVLLCVGYAAMGWTTRVVSQLRFFLAIACLAAAYWFLAWVRAERARAAAEKRARAASGSVDTERGETVRVWLN